MLALICGTAFTTGCAQQSETDWDGYDTWKAEQEANANKPGDGDNGGEYTPVDRKAPLYWSVYEYCYTREQKDVSRDLTREGWQTCIDWVGDNLRDYGYDMLCTDGFMSMTNDPAVNANGYMTHYGGIPLTELVKKCKEKGLKLGVYDNPLWRHAGDETPVDGRPDVTLGDLKYNESIDLNTVEHPDADDGFWWIVASHDGAKEYIDGFFKYYKSIGVDFIRADFLCWYEDGWDRGFNAVKGKGYGRENYRLALKYMREAADKYGVFLSLVMPHMKNNAKYEAEYGDMARIVADTGGGGWWHCSQSERGKIFADWPSACNMFDGFIYWSQISGRDKMILDGDFTRLNTFGNDDEKQTVISIQLMAGGPVSVADNPIDESESQWKHDLQFYQNEEMLALNKDGFVGKPLSTNSADSRSQIWYGQMQNGDYIVGLFNRNDSEETRSVDFEADLGIKELMNVRDLWAHIDEGAADKIEKTIPAHGCKVYRLTPRQE